MQWMGGRAARGRPYLRVQAGNCWPSLRLPRLARFLHHRLPLRLLSGLQLLTQRLGHHPGEAAAGRLHGPVVRRLLRHRLRKRRPRRHLRRAKPGIRSGTPNKSASSGSDVQRPAARRPRLIPTPQLTYGSTAACRSETTAGAFPRSLPAACASSHPPRPPPWRTFGRRVWQFALSCVISLV